MKRLRVILQSKYFIISLCLFTLIYSFLVIYNNINTSKYKIETNKIIGKINNIDIDGDKVTLIVKGKEKIIINYYMKEEKEIKSFKQLRLGDKIIAEGAISLPSRNQNFNLFNYQNYLLSKKISWIMTADKIKLTQKNHNIFYSIKNIIKKRIDKIGNSYLNTFILGDNSNTSKNIISSYRTNGISHLFALSGMHVSLISICMLFFLDKINKHKYFNKIIVSGFLIFYSFLVNFTPSIMRATIFFIVLFINNKRIKTLNLYIIFTCIMLIINPYSIYNTGFLFSYTVTLYLIICSNLINSYKRYFSKILITSLIAFLVGIPIMINSFYTINIVSFIFNLFYVPFISFIVLPLTFITFILPWFNNLLIPITNFLEYTSLLLAKLNFLSITLKHVNVFILLFYYVVINFILYKMFKRKYWYLMIIIILLFIHSQFNYLKCYSVINMIDVGQGDSTFISLSHNKANILIDTGGKISYNKEKWKQREKNYSIATGTIIPYLKSMGITKLNYLILTHGDFDHMGEAINLVNNIKIENVIFNNDSYNELEQELIKVLEKKKIRYYKGLKELNIDNDKLYFLNTKEYDNENDNSNVVYFKINEFKFLFMGDAGIEREKDILDKYNLNDIDFIKIGHHGSNTSSSIEFIDNIKPKNCLISVGVKNRYGHPKQTVLDTLDDYCNIYRTDLNGSVEIKINKNNYKIKTYSP